MTCLMKHVLCFKNVVPAAADASGAITLLWELSLEMGECSRSLRHPLLLKAQDDLRSLSTASRSTSISIV